MPPRRQHRHKPKRRPGRPASRAAAPAPARPESRGGRAPSLGQSFEELVRLQGRLLAPGGCPWDREQTHHTLRTYLLEEAYEVLEAIESGDPGKLREELGDLLLQVVFHAALAEQARRFTVGEVIRGVHAKMVRRHPHVFGGAAAAGAGEVLRNWEQLKAAERAQAAAAGNGAPRAGKKAAAPAGASLLDGVPRTLPALLEAYQLTRRAARIGFDWEELGGVLEKLSEEAAELAAAARSAKGRGAAAHRERIEEEVGDLLFAAANVARFLEVDPEIALRRANRKFAARFRMMEAASRRRGNTLARESREEMEALWERAKRLA